MESNLARLQPFDCMELRAATFTPHRWKWCLDDYRTCSKSVGRYEVSPRPTL